MANTKTRWYWFRRVWATLGMLSLLGFASWSFIAYRASSGAQIALGSDEQVTVFRGADHWVFSPLNTERKKVGLVFFPGALVEPAAYAPILREIAFAGYPVILVELPQRGVFGGADGAKIINRARRAMQDLSSVSDWVVSGHSRGGAVAARFAKQSGKGVKGLVLIGTSHPREFSLAGTNLQVMKILGTQDGVSPIKKSENNRHLLPASSRWVFIEGGNHSQFGRYGFQPWDHFATIDRDLQQELTRKAILDALKSAGRINASD